MWKSFYFASEGLSTAGQSWDSCDLREQWWHSASTHTHNRVHPIPGQQKSLIPGMVQHTAAEQEEWGEFLKRIDGIISQEQLN